MTDDDYDKLVGRLTNDYFLVKKRLFLFVAAGAVAGILVLSGVTYNSVANLIKEQSETGALAEINELRDEAAQRTDEIKAFQEQIQGSRPIIAFGTASLDVSHFSDEAGGNALSDAIEVNLPDGHEALIIPISPVANHVVLDCVPVGDAFRIRASASSKLLSTVTGRTVELAALHVQYLVVGPSGISWTIDEAF